MRHKNDYTCIVFYKDTKPKKWQFVHGLTQFAKFLNTKHPNWTHINVYERRTGTFLKRFYPGSSIPYFLSLAPFLLLYFFLTFNSSPSITFINGIYNTATISTAQKGGSECF